MCEIWQVGACTGDLQGMYSQAEDRNNDHIKNRVGSVVRSLTVQRVCRFEASFRKRGRRNHVMLCNRGEGQEGSHCPIKLSRYSIGPYVNKPISHEVR